MAKMLQISCIFVTFILLFSCFCSFSSSISLNLTLPHEHPYPEHIVQEFHRRVNVSLWRRKTLTFEDKDQLSCVTGNPIDDCWKCDPNWAANRQQLADCAIGFGYKAIGGKGGPIYVVTDSSDPDPHQPKPGTLRDAVSQPGPVWIIFAADMLIKLNSPLMVTSFKTIDGRGAHVEITGGGCISIEHVTNVIIHNINIHHCYPKNSDGDGIHIFSSSNVWVDHCTLANCADGLIDCTVGSTAITISNNYFSHHDKVMLLGHSDDYPQDRGMQITVAFNRFGEALTQRMPRCRFGYFHVVNNDYTSWGEYAVGGSSRPTINSQGNRYIAPPNPNAKEVTKRLDAGEEEWAEWNWRTEGDLMVNGAFFVPSGDGVTPQFTLASSMQPQPAAYIDQLTNNAGILLPNGGAPAGIAGPGSRGSGFSVGGGLFPGSTGTVPGGMFSGGANAPPGDSGFYGGGDGGGLFFSNATPSPSYKFSTIFSALIILTFYISTNDHFLLQFDS
ncbi:putative pectate lyase 5 [Silene latifolia]|uniref:putative pectate lyase 5 n=1 Tax=Silene latifolia TaxID=37657 RepID=UPI003D77D01E